MTRTLNIPVRLTVEGGRFSVEGEADIRQTDYGITPFSVLGGALAVKDALRVIFRIEGVRVGTGGQEQGGRRSDEATESGRVLFGNRGETELRR